MIKRRKRERDEKIIEVENRMETQLKIETKKLNK